MDVCVFSPAPSILTIQPQYIATSLVSDHHSHPALIYVYLDQLPLSSIHNICQFSPETLQPSPDICPFRPDTPYPALIYAHLATEELK